MLFPHVLQRHSHGRRHAYIPCARSRSQSAGQTTASTRTSSSELEIVQMRPNFHMIAGAGGNVAVQVGVDGVCSSTRAPAPHRRVMSVSDNHPQARSLIINTSADHNHVGGNDRFLQAGQRSFDTIANLFPRNYFQSGAVAILATEAVIRRMGAPTGQTRFSRLMPGQPKRSRRAAAMCISMTRESK